MLSVRGRRSPESAPGVEGPEHMCREAEEGLGFKDSHRRGGAWSNFSGSLDHYPWEARLCFPTQIMVLGSGYQLLPPAV